jgi:serine protease Do
MGNVKPRGFIGWIGAIIVIGVLWIGMGCQQAPQEGKTEKSSEPKTTPTANIAPGPVQPVEETSRMPLNLVTGIIQVAKSNIPSVVHIEVTERQELANPFLPFEKDPKLRRYFGLPKKMPKKFERELVGIGTGMIIDPQGHILTNNHVVGGASKIQVTLSNGEEYPGTVIGTDPKTDLGVIQISAKGPLPCVTFGDSDRVQVGQWVVAIGHPRGLDQTVTQGIISAKHRAGITDPNGYQDFLQTDAAINPGNSGGPLLTLGGEVIGVNSVIVSESGGSEGIGFAIPSNMAVHIAKILIAHGKVERGWLGINVSELPAELAKSLSLAEAKGALIADVTKEGPADKAGIKKGDVVVAYEGKEIPDAVTLRNLVADSPIGQEVKVTVWRDRKRQEIAVKVGNLEDLAKMLNASLKDRLGVEVKPAAANDLEKYGLNLPGGVLALWVEPKGPLGKVGFEVGDIILGIEGHPIVNMEGFAEVVKMLPPKQKVSLSVLDHQTGQTGYIQVIVR